MVVHLLWLRASTSVARPSRLHLSGDGDLACIGTCETIHAPNRGEHIAIIFINNAIYGMTGGQMAPTTLLGQKTATCPYGREADLHGYPLNITELASHLQGTCYVTRQSVETVASIKKAKKAIRKAFEASMQGKGSSLVEIVSTCNSGWKLSPVEANKWMEENMFKQYPKGDRRIQQICKNNEDRNHYIRFWWSEVLSMGKILAYSGLMEDKEVTWMPAYGPEQRGGTANVTVIVSDSRISSPILSHYDVAIVLNQPSLDKFEPKIKPGGIPIYDGYGIMNPPQRKDITVYRIDAMDKAAEMKNSKVFNMIVLGGLLKVCPVVSTDGLNKALFKSLLSAIITLDSTEYEGCGRGYENHRESRTISFKIVR